MPTRFIELAGEINAAMPHYVVSRAAELLDARKGLSLSQAKILMIGVAYKKNVDDTRESPALNILEILQERGAKVDFHDPHVMVIPETRRHPKLTGMKSVALDPAAIGRYDVVLIITDHSAVDYQLLVDSAQLVVDTRNATAKVSGRAGKVFTA